MKNSNDTVGNRTRDLPVKELQHHGAESLASDTSQNLGSSFQFGTPLQNFSAFVLS
jgi:hypothetical protein